MTRSMLTLGLVGIVYAAAPVYAAPAHGGHAAPAHAGHAAPAHAGHAAPAHAGHAAPAHAGHPGSGHPGHAGVGHPAHAGVGHPGHVGPGATNLGRGPLVIPGRVGPQTPLSGRLAPRGPVVGNLPQISSRLPVRTPVGVGGPRGQGTIIAISPRLAGGIGGPLGYPGVAVVGIPAFASGSGIPFGYPGTGTVVADEPIVPVSADEPAPAPVDQTTTELGLKIVKVKEGAAKTADLREGDVILAVGTNRVQSVVELQNALATVQGTVDVTFMNGETGKVERLPLVLNYGKIGADVIPVAVN